MTFSGVIGIALSFLSREINSLKKLPLVIAIDGHSSSGKSTLAKDLSGLLDYIHIDSGAMYRAVTLYFLNHNISVSDEEKIKTALANIQIRFSRQYGKVSTILNDKNVEADIRTMRVSDQVSEVAAISAVRRFLVAQQREMRGSTGMVMDGRDIGTVVFPDADVKLFVTASIDSRTTRRYLELFERGIDITEQEVRENLQERDYIDSNREDSPLRQAEDAVLLDTSKLDRQAQVAKAIEIISTAIKKS